MWLFYNFFMWGNLHGYTLSGKKECYVELLPTKTPQVLALPEVRGLEYNKIHAHPLTGISLP